ncbi:MAG TPA: hypothetical protein VGE37_03200, partial [Archangium sp.]
MTGQYEPALPVDASPPTLNCPACGVPLIEAQGRGRHDRDGNYIEHREGCRCAWCGWMWFDDMEPMKCTCGALVRVEIDDETAFAKVVENAVEPVTAPGR